MTQCATAGTSLTLAIDPEDDHRRKTGNNALTLLSLFNISFEQLSGTRGLHPSDSSTVRQAMAWQPTAQSMNDRQGEYSGTFSCTTAALYRLTVRVGNAPLHHGA